MPAKVWHVLVSGAAGGALSWVFAVTVGLPLAVTNWLVALPAASALGAGASFLGIYLLAGTDTAQANRCLAFALLCGFSWKPVFDAGSALLNQSIQRHEVRTKAGELEGQSQAVRQRLGSAAEPKETASAIDEAVAVTTELNRAAEQASAPDPALADKLTLTAADTVVAALSATTEPGQVESLPVAETRRKLESARLRWAERDPGRAAPFGLAISNLDKAVAARQ